MCMYWKRERKEKILENSAVSRGDRLTPARIDIYVCVNVYDEHSKQLTTQYWMPWINCKGKKKKKKKRKQMHKEHCMHVE